MISVTNESRTSAFLANLAAAGDSVLLLDYEGTLAPPFPTDRKPSPPYPGVRRLLQFIHAKCSTRMIVVSSGPAHELPPLLGVPLEIWGNYGLERLSPSGQYEYTDLQATKGTLFALAEVEAALSKGVCADLVEVKLSGIAVHWNNLKPLSAHEVQRAALELFEPASSMPGLVLTNFDDGAELGLREANKGDAVRRLLRDLPMEVPIAYLGGDSTDEDAFHALNGRGLCVLVRSAMRFTAADVWLRPPQELIVFLEDWLLAAGSRS